MNNDNGELLRMLRKEEANRKENKPEVALASKSKKGGEAMLSGAAPKKGQKSGTPFPLPNGCEIVCRSGDRRVIAYKLEANITDHVFLIRSYRSQKLYAMKIEWLNAEKSSKQMIRDVRVLLDVGKHEPRFSRRVPKALNFLIMTLGDMNLNDLRLIVNKNCDFSRRDAARLSMQTFQAVHDLHTLGYLHRNLSPAKFVLGIDNPHIVYLIGFSRAHHFEQRYDTKPRGTPRRLPRLSARSFLPRNYHRNKDIHRKDDMESWVYLCFNLFGRQLLPWNEQFSDANMMVNKERLFCDGFEQCYKYVPRQFLTIMHNLDKHEDKQRPDYTFIGMTLVAMKESIKFHFTGPFDFQKPHKKALPPVEEKQEKQAALAVAEPKDEIVSPVPKSEKKRPAFKDDEDEQDSTDKSSKKASSKKASSARSGRSARTSRSPASARDHRVEMERARRQKEEAAAKLEAMKAEEAIEREREEKDLLTRKLASVVQGKAQHEIDRERREKNELMAKLAAAKAGQNEGELEKIRREKKELETRLLAAKDEGKTQEERERIRKEKEEMLAKMTELEIEQSRAKIERERQEKEELALKIATARAEQAKAALERERKEKEEMAKKLAEIEAQTKREEEAAKEAKEQQQATKMESPTEKKSNQSVYFTLPK